MRAICILLIVLASDALRAEEAVVTLRSTVTGNREQPRVMYLVPWQQPENPQSEYRLRGGFADELFQPVDRAEFVRALNFRALVNGAGGGVAAGQPEQPLSNE